MKTIVTASILFLTGIVSAQLYQGPANGSVPNGVIVNTNNFSDMPGDYYSNIIRKPRNILIAPEERDDGKVPPTGPRGSNEVHDVSVTGGVSESDASPMLLKSFQGFNDPGSYIPPDPYCAAGPTHIMGVDNGRLRIWTKNGQLVKTIIADVWFGTTLSGVGAFDPKVSYDAFAKRWIMVWLDQNDPPNPRGYFLVSASDDSNPIGQWVNWAISNTLNGSSESGTWSDYQGVGFDNQALYIVGRQFGFSGGFFGCKIRIVAKSNLYANTGGQLTWTDLWDIRNPENMNQRPDGIRPTICYTVPAEAYFMTYPFSSGTYVLLYKLINPLSNPSMTGVSVPVTAYSSPPSPQQLGGGSLPIEHGGSALRNEPAFRNGFLWLTHSVAFGGGYSGANYLKVNPATNTAVEDFTFGATNYYHFYPAVSVGQNMEILLNFSRSSATEYIGAYFTGRLNSDPPGQFSPGMPLKVGKANYVKDFGSGRNRWGDYMGSWVDPADPSNFWILTEYAESPANTWGVWTGNVRLVPFSGARIFSSRDTLTFATTEVGFSSDELRLRLSNYGSDTLVITNMIQPPAHFTITSTHNYPIRLGYQDSVSVVMVFSPTAAGNFIDSLRVISNDPINPSFSVYLKGKGFSIAPASGGVLYGVTGSQENGALLTINTTNGGASTVGLSGYSQLNGMSVKPSNDQIYATFSGTTTALVRINASAGDAYLAAVIPINVRAIAFDLDNDLYCATYTDGKLYKFANNDTDFVGTTGITNLSGLAFNPLNGQLWGCSISNSIYKINKQTGVATLVGSTGLSSNTSVAFGLDGKLYGIRGIGTQICDLVRIDTSSGAGTIIGSTGKRTVNGIAMSPNPIGIEPISSTIPDKFALYQNYPNPFNPSTKINFDLPRNVQVKISIYDILGREVEIIANEMLKAGRYSLQWDGIDYPSGIYFYRIETSEFVDARKMILVK
jgi:hypothetical protein